MPLQAAVPGTLALISKFGNSPTYLRCPDTRSIESYKLTVELGERLGVTNKGQISVTTGRTARDSANLLGSKFAGFGSEVRC